MVGILKLLADGQRAGVVTAAAGHTGLGNIDAIDLGNLQALLPENYSGNGKWYINGAGLPAFIKAGAQIYGKVDTPTGPRPLFAFGGAPVILTPKMPGSGVQSGKPVVLYGDMKSAVILGCRRGVTVRASSARYLERDQLLVRGTARWETVPHNLGDSGKAGALVGLLAA